MVLSQAICKHWEITTNLPLVAAMLVVGSAAIVLSTTYYWYVWYLRREIEKLVHFHLLELPYAIPQRILSPGSKRNFSQPWLLWSNTEACV